MRSSRAIVMLKTILDSSAYASDSSVEELWGRDWLKTMFFCLFVCFCFRFFFLPEFSLLFLVDMIAETFPHSDTEFRQKSGTI